MDTSPVTINQLASEIRERQQAEGAFGREAAVELIDEVLEEKRALGILPDDFDFKGAQEKLEYLLAQEHDQEQADEGLGDSDATGDD